MLFGRDGDQVPGQGQPNWTPAQFLQNLSNFFNGNEKALAWLQQNFQGPLTPAQWWQLSSYFIAWQTYRAVNWTLRSLRFLVQLSPLLAGVGLNLSIANLGALAPVAGVSGLAGLSGLSGLAGVAVPPVMAAPAPVAPVISGGTAPPAAAAAPGPAAPAAPAAVIPTAPAAAPPPPPVPPLIGTEGTLHSYLVGWLPASQRTAATAASKAARPAPDIAAAAAAAEPARAEARHPGRRRGRLIDPGYRYEYLDGQEPEAGERVRHSSAGFAGTLAAPGVRRAAGLAELTRDEFGSGPTVPMLPDSWETPSAGTP